MGGVTSRRADHILERGQSWSWFRLLVCLVVSLVGVCALGACQPQSKQGVELEFWSIALKPTFVPYMEGIFKQFERTHPGVKVRWLDLPYASIMPKLMASIAGGVAPDLVNLNTATALRLARRGALTELNARVPAEQRSVYWPHLWQAASNETGTYAVPWYLSTRVLMYNRQLLRQAGWQGAAPKNWEDMERMARLVRQNTGAYGCEPVVRLAEEWQRARVPIYDAVSRKAVFNTELGQRCLARYSAWRQQDLIPKETLIEGYAGAINRYKQGKLALLEAGPQLLLGIKADAPEVYAQTDIAPLPVEDNGEIPGALMNLVVPQASKHRDLAVELALLLTSPGNQLKFVQQVPLLPSVRVPEDAVLGSYRQDGQLFAKALRISLAQLSLARDFSLDLPRSSELEKVLKDAVEASFYGQDTPARALERAEEQWNKIVSPR